MLENHKIKQLLTSNYYEVKNEIQLKLGENEYKNESTFNLFIKKLDNLKYDIFFDRSNFKINGEEVEKKFSLLSHQYFSCIYPLRFSIKDNALVVINFREVMERITEKDQDLKEDYDGDGLDYIREQFLDKVNTSEKLQDFISSLSIVKIIALSLQRFDKSTDNSIQWKLPAVSTINFKINTESDKNKVTYKAVNTNKALFINQMNAYCQDNKLRTIPDTLDPTFVSTFNQTVLYNGETLGFSEAQTSIKTTLEAYFDYEETISLQSKI